MSQTVSRIETARNDLVTQLKTMSVANGYRNDYADVIQVFRDISQITEFPIIRVFWQSGSLSALDSVRGAFSEKWQVLVVALVDNRSTGNNDGEELIDNAESVLHDLKKCLTSFTVTNLHTANKNYFIDGKEDIFKVYPLMPIDKAVGEVAVGFTIKVRWDDYTTTES